MAEGEGVPAPEPKAKAKKRPAKARPAPKKAAPARKARSASPRATGRQLIALDGDVILLIRKKQGEIQAKTGQRITMSEAATIAIRGK